MNNPLSGQFSWQTLLPGSQRAHPIPAAPRVMFVVVVVGCVLFGLPWLALLPLATWNTLVALRNRWRCPNATV